ncbi:unnamed protein product, partial [Heterosigma akashiwo]
SALGPTPTGISCACWPSRGAATRTCACTRTACGARWRSSWPAPRRPCSPRSPSAWPPRTWRCSPTRCRTCSWARRWWWPGGSG